MDMFFERTHSRSSWLTRRAADGQKDVNTTNMSCCGASPAANRASDLHQYEAAAGAAQSAGKMDR
jgi:hypothetical protein